MPGYKAHLSGALVAYAGVALLIFPVDFTVARHLELVLCMLAGALFPDVDIKSKGQRIFYLLVIPSALMLWIGDFHVMAFALAIGAFLPLVCAHRGLFHKISFLFFVSCIFFIIGFSWCTTATWAVRMALNAVFFFFGTVTHIILDIGLRRFIAKF